MSESLAKGIAKQVTDSITETPNPSKFEVLEGLSHRKKIKQMRKECKTNNKLALLGEKNPKSSKWILVWGEWAGTYAKPSINMSIGNYQHYDKLGFDLVINDREGVKQKFLYVTLTKHALERLILRSGEWLNSTEKVREFMNGFIEPLIRFSLSMVEDNSYENKSDSAEKNIIIDNCFFAIVMTKGVNKHGEIARSFNIKTIKVISYFCTKKTSSFSILTKKFHISDNHLLPH